MRIKADPMLTRLWATQFLWKLSGSRKEKGWETLG